MQRKNGVIVGNGDYWNAPSTWEFVECMSLYFFEGLADEVAASCDAGYGYSILSDGSTDRSTTEAEAIYIRLNVLPADAIGGCAANVRTRFAGLEPIDRAKSKDKKSFDAPAVKAAFDSALASDSAPKMLKAAWDNKHRKLVGGSFDGAAVMIGRRKGVVALLKEEVGHFVGIHAVAHNLELAIGDVWEQMDYIGNDMPRVLNSIHAHYSQSAKRQGSRGDISKHLGVVCLKLTSLHGIRWRNSQKRSSQALLSQWDSIAADLQARAYVQVGCTLSELSDDSAFWGYKVDTRHVNPQTGRSSTWQARVKEGDREGEFTYKYSNGDIMDKVTRAEVLTDIGENTRTHTGV